MSYRNRHVKSKIHKIKSKKPFFARPVFWILFLIIIVLVFAVYFVFFCSNLHIKNILISGSGQIEKEKIEPFILSNCKRKIIGYGELELASKNILLVDLDNIKKEILNRFPQIEKVDIATNFPQTLMVGITKREPSAVFCNSLGDSKDNCFFIDDNGIIFQALAQAPNNTLIVRQLIIKNDVFAGENIIDKNVMDAILKIEKNLKDKFKINVKEALVSSPLRLDITTDENWKAYFDLNSNIDLQISKIDLLFTEEIPQNIRKGLQYVDLRFKDRAYYK